MEEIDMKDDGEQFINRVTDSAIRLGLLGLLVMWCLQILMPFISPVLWGIILAVSLAPLHGQLASKLGGRPRLASGLMALVGLVTLLVPATLISISLVKGAHQVSLGIQEGTLQVPPVPESIEQWPLIGGGLHEFWASAADDLKGALAKYAPQLGDAVKGLERTTLNLVRDIFLFALSILIAAALMATGPWAEGVTNRLATRVAGERGPELVKLSTLTMRSVAQGVVGIAVIQGVASWIGMAVVGVPGAPVWSLAVFLLAVMQLPPLLVLGPVAAFVFSSSPTVTAVLFLVWSVVVSFSDTILKPLFLGRGVDVPMLVILLGAIGGMITAGISGLFVGAVVLAVGYTLLHAWLEQADAVAAAQTTEGAGAPQGQQPESA